MNTIKVDQPTIGTFLKCAVTLRHEDPDGFYFTNTTCPGPDDVIYISALGARMLAEAEGYVSPAEHQDALGLLMGVQAQLDAAIEELAELRDFKDRALGFTASGEYELVRRTGAPSKTTKREAIEADIKEKAGVSA